MTVNQNSTWKMKLTNRYQTTFVDQANNQHFSNNTYIRKMQLLLRNKLLTLTRKERRLHIGLLLTLILLIHRLAHQFHYLLNIDFLGHLDFLVGNWGVIEFFKPW